jgi:hypothetical protein
VPCSRSAWLIIRGTRNSKSCIPPSIIVSQTSHKRTLEALYSPVEGEKKRYPRFSRG